MEQDEIKTEQKEENFEKNHKKVGKNVQIIVTEEKADENEKDEVSNYMDYVLEETGQFGKHQIFHLVLILLPIILSGTYDVNFIVTSATDEYR